MNARDYFDWSDEVIARLRKLWAEGHSAQEIGRRLGCSKNAVVGKVARLGLSHRPSPIRPRKESKATPTRHDIPVPKATLPPLASATTLPLSGVALRGALVAREKAARTTIVAISAAARPTVPGLCCWPIGEPGTRSFRYCDVPEVVVGRPYCVTHCERAYVTATRSAA